LEEIEKIDVVETTRNIAKYIKENLYLTTKLNNALFIMAMKEAGIKEALGIVEEAVRKLIEKTVEKTGKRPRISAERIALWLMNWREIADDLTVIEIYAGLRLLVIKRMLRGDFWIKEIGKNLVIITDGEGTYEIADGSLIP